MITSFFPGRVRLRAPIFKEEDLVAQAQKNKLSQMISTLEGIF